MRPLELTASLAAFERRGPGTDAERRAARWLASQLRGTGRRVSIEPFWCRPNWALAHAWHVALALAGSLISVSHPAIGVALLAVALASLLADGLTGVSLGRRLTPERASQNVVVTPAAATPTHSAAPQNPATLVVTANYDAPRNALVDRDALRRPAAALRRLAGPLALGWLGCLSLAIVWVLAIAVIRLAAHASSTLLGVIQLPPSIALVLALALLLEAAGAGYRPGDADNASGVAVASALVSTLLSASPRNLNPELVLQGAGGGHEIGIRRYLKTHAHELGQTIVLGIAPCGAGTPRWWRSDGRLIPIGYTRRLRDLARGVADDQTREHRGRGGTPALPARTRARIRARPLPAIAIGNLDAHDLPRGRQAHIDPAALSHAIELGLLLVEAIDAELEADPADANSAPTPA